MIEERTPETLDEDHPGHPDDEGHVGPQIAEEYWERHREEEEEGHVKEDEQPPEPGKHHVDLPERIRASGHPQHRLPEEHQNAGSRHQKEAYEAGDVREPDSRIEGT